MNIRKMDALVIGSGAAGLCAAVRLHALGIRDLAIYTEGLDQGTSINTGSDKQTYYKLGMYGLEPDSPVMMAKDMSSSGASHGDIALAEAATSSVAFAHLIQLGVPFPHDKYGQYIGYKTDHDPRRRATSCGPYTSREMCRALISNVRLRGIEVCENRIAVKLFTSSDGSRCTGAMFLDPLTGEREAVSARNIVFAVGGPGGLYETSVYPECHTGAIGLAIEAGGKAYNLAESQFGLASLKFRWNVSGSFMQVLPRFVSVDEHGTEREFLRDYFTSAAEMYGMIFLKGYQWPFSAGHVPGSSLVDIYTYIETVERGRKVYLDYRTDPADFDFDSLPEETRDYLIRSGAAGNTPLERLEKLNAPSIQLYLDHGIDLKKEMLQVAVCAQHNNGGLAADNHWQSVNLSHFYPVGEVNGSHGVTRPGGTALNAGQVGAFRASEHIVLDKSEAPDGEEFQKLAEQENALLEARMQLPPESDWQTERKEFQKRMSAAGAFIRSTEKVVEALDGAWKQYPRIAACGLAGLSPKDTAETLRNRQLCLAHLYYLECILMQIDYIGSRGGSLVLAPDGEEIPGLKLNWRIKKENTDFRQRMMFCRLGQSGYPEIGWELCRPVPEPDGWFETVWKEYREQRQEK